MIKDAFDFPAFGVATRSAAIIERAAAATLPMSGLKTTDNWQLFRFKRRRRATFIERRVDKKVPLRATRPAYAAPDGALFCEGEPHSIDRTRLPRCQPNRLGQFGHDPGDLLAKKPSTPGCWMANAVRI
jgi:hypothetical protein